MLFLKPGRKPCSAAKIMVIFSNIIPMSSQVCGNYLIASLTRPVPVTLHKPDYFVHGIYLRYAYPVRWVFI